MMIGVLCKPKANTITEELKMIRMIIIKMMSVDNDDDHDDDDD